MADIPIVHTNLSLAEIVLNQAGGMPSTPNGRPRAIISFDGGNIVGEIIGMSLTPNAGEAMATARNYKEAVLHINPDGGRQVLAPLDRIEFINWET